MISLQVHRFYETIRHLRPKQVFFRCYYRCIPYKAPHLDCTAEAQIKRLTRYPNKPISLREKQNRWSFSFLNIEQEFEVNQNPWTGKTKSLLWNYNLNYFDWLNQPTISRDLGESTISSFYEWKRLNALKYHPYPASLRVINISKFICQHNLCSPKWFDSFLLDLHLISKRLEYHLLGNHLLENAFALFIGGLVSNQPQYINLGEKLLREEFVEQILEDGMHYERSPMYHDILLERTLDALNFAKAYDHPFQEILKSRAAQMMSFTLNWQDLPQFPMFQDSAYDIALPHEKLRRYAMLLLGNQFPKAPAPMTSCGYRIISNSHFKLIANIGEISPSYQPGHAHADELNFECFYKNKAFIVDRGITTYDDNDKRHSDRATVSHNCVTIQGRNSSDVWSAFRVGRRSNVKSSAEANKLLAVRYDYNSACHVERTFALLNDTIEVRDSVKKMALPNTVQGRLHFHPSVSTEQLSDNSFLFKLDNHVATMSFENAISCKLEPYPYSLGFNKSLEATSIVYTFSRSTQITIQHLT